jgi:diguanylate cyclase (GGDEF)-like protein
MMLFLPGTFAQERDWSEIFLDLFQVAIVVSLIYSTFFFLPDRHMLAADAYVHSLTVSDLQSVLLLIAGFVRLQFARGPSTRILLLRLNTFLLTCAVTTFTGDWVELHYHAHAAWFDLGWSVPIIVAALIALTWTASSEPESSSDSPSFLGFLGTNLVLVAMLSCIALLTDRWKQAHGVTLTNIAIAASLLSLTLRLALTQFHQHREIAQRKSAQQQLAVSHEKVAHLFADAQLQSAAITEVNQLGSLLQACNSREEVFLLVSARMIHVFPASCGALWVRVPSLNRSEVVAHWEVRPSSSLAPLDENAFRVASSSVSAHLIANGDVFGALVVHHEVPVVPAGALARPDEIDQRRQIVSAIAEQIALTISNLDLREALKAQAIRDSLTGLYNRRYMEEFLERELHRASRRERPVSVLMFDVDDFKLYNDTFGHAAGDDALRLVAETLQAGVRSEDLACRYGGEEFILILPECPLPQATVRAEELRSRVRGLHAVRPGKVRRDITVSIGVAAFRETTGRIDLLVDCADKALYEAKREGRDRVVTARQEPSDFDPSSPHPTQERPLVPSSESPLRS